MRLLAGGLCAGVLLALLPGAFAGAGTPAKISFKKLQLDKVFRSEGVAVGDFNGDRKLDIAAGSVYYAAPDWRMKSFLDKPKTFQPKGYSDAFCCFADDINGDGRTDLVQVDQPGVPTCWFENPGTAGVAWKRHMAVPVTNNESPLWVDIDGDGRRELLFGHSPEAKKPDSPQRRMAFAGPGPDPRAPWPIRTFSVAGAPGSKKYAHGLGCGDVNGDGRIDVLVLEGWWEHPADRNRPEWTFHKVNFGEHCVEMPVHDFDGDGDADVLTTSAHRFGIWWHEQTPEGWKTHQIDKSFSQTHAVCLSDINGDGLIDFVTGKRWYAHGGRDPGADQPAVLYWFEMNRKAGRPTWTRHLIDDASGVGTQFQVTDVNGDGLPDIAIANKKGVFYFEQVRN